MNLRNTLKIGIFALGVTLSPSLFAASYTWNFGGSGDGSSMTFNSTTAGGPTIKATAWYIDGGSFKSATIYQFGYGLGICNPDEWFCTLTQQHQTDNNNYDEFVLFEFSTPVDPTTVRVTTTTNNGGDTDASFWLGGNAGQNLNLNNVTVAQLAGLGFGPENFNTASNIAEDASRDILIPPSGAYVNKMLFGPRLGENDDFFKITSMTGNTSVPEPSSMVLLGTVGLAALYVARKRARRA